MKTIFALAIIILIVTSCRKNFKQVTYFENGEIKSIIYFNEEELPVRIKKFYENGRIKSDYVGTINNIGNHKNFYDLQGIRVGNIRWLDSANAIQQIFYRNGNLKSQGKLFNNKKIDWWLYYDRNNRILKKEEIKIINGQEYLNQRIVYNKDGIDKKLSFYFTVNLPDTVSIGRHTGTVTCIPYFQSGSIMTCIGKNLYPDFSNVYTTKIDTFYAPSRNDIWFGIENQNSGSKVLRGFVREESFEINRDSTDLQIKARNMYFEKNIFVKKSL